MRSTRLIGVLLVALASSACAGAGAASAGRVHEAETMRAGLSGREAQALAPEAFAAADLELRLAREAKAAGDPLASELHADRALAAYNHAVALARLAHATRDEAAANEVLGRATEEARRYATQRKTVDHEADDLEKKLRVAREAQLPPASGPADPERERARGVAALALVSQARLLCGAARLVSAQAPGLAEAETTVVALEKQGEGARVAIDPAARARAACLGSLTRARRAVGTEADQADTLLGELSQSGASDARAARRGNELTPTRDERGVVVTLHGAFKGDKPTPEAEAQLKDLGRVAAAHPSFGVQVVLHDATPPGAAEVLANQKRGEATTRLLVEGGAAAPKVKVEQLGARAPVVDPKDPHRRERNTRLEIVFVSTGS